MSELSGQRIMTRLWRTENMEKIEQRNIKLHGWKGPRRSSNQGRGLVGHVGQMVVQSSLKML